ncbi:hypothetical protein QAD02_015123 [Eretmocerus hayati]|uniref:Uncharacterized protein n=1 Tax=Eretmocerus hayati TaxID=131215 RepID=A0ACC2P8K9_9HYME|nr:hypothetical protein QAD02_015123 [Eretmocerus hayati]
MLRSTVRAKPAVDHEPIKFSLDPSDDPNFKAIETPIRDEISTRIENGREWLARMADAIRFGRGRFVNSIAIARNIIAERVEELMSETRNNVAGAIGAANDIIEKSRTTLRSYDKGPVGQFLAPAQSRETARLENESDQAFLEKRKPNPIGSLIENIVKPTPIVDGINEEDKYGNQGDRFIGVGRALVNGVEGLSNIFNAVLEFPVSAAKQTSRGITEVFNKIGAKLVGLQ